MRDDSYQDYKSKIAETAEKSWKSSLATAFGAGASLLIIAGVVIWSYRFTVRDIEDIPVIRAEAGLARARPEESDAQKARAQEKSVYGLVTGGGENAQPVATVSTAPPPETLREEDKAPAILNAPPPDPRPGHETAAAETPATPAAAGTELSLEDIIDAAVAEVTSEDSFTAPPPRQRPDRSTIIRRREAAPEPREAAAASDVQIQLGAFVSEEIARQQWARIKGANTDLLTGRGRVISPVSSGGRTLWRLRAGPFSDISDASALCNALQARNYECIVARRS